MNRVFRRPVSLDKHSFMALDFLCCVLVAASALLIIEPIFPFQSAPVLLMTGPLLITSFFFACEYNKHIGLISLALLVLLLIVLFWIGGKEFRHYAAGFISWWMELFPEDSPYYRTSSIVLVLFLIHFLVTAVVFLFIRFTRGALTLLTAALLLLVSLFLYDFSGSRLASTGILAGALPLMVKSRFLYYDRHRSGMVTSEKHTALPAVAVGSAIALLAALITPQETSGWRDVSLYNHINRLISLELWDAGGNQAGSLSGMGLQPDLSRLGGDISLNDTTPVMQVKGRQPCSLKGLVYRQYDGSSWQDPSEAGILFYSGSSGYEQTNAFGYSLISDDRLLQPVNLEISVLSRDHHLYTNGRVHHIQWLDPSMENCPIYFYPRSEMLYYGEATAPYRYRMTADVFQRNAASFDSLIQEVERNHPPDISDQTQDTCLKLPYDTIPEEIRRTTEALFDGSETPYQKMVILEQYLRDRTHFTYTLTPGPVPEEEDFVTYFLKEKKGYCVYFASAMAIIARSLHIPSRFIAGYRVNGTGQEDVIVQARDAHAWVECYFKGIGWVPFDPTPGATLSVAPAVDTTVPTVSAPSPSTGDEQPTLSSSSASREPATAADATSPPHQPGQDHRMNPLLFLFSLPVLLVLLTAFVLLQYYRSLTLFPLNRLRTACHSGGKVADAYYRDMLVQLRLLSLIPATDETLKRFAIRVDMALGSTDRETAGFGTAAEILMRWRYAQTAPSDSDLEKLEQIHNRLESILRERCNGLVYFVHRILLIRRR